ncbi:MAG: hypothetical protein ACQEWE_16360 [Bacillota bacterium]
MSILIGSVQLPSLWEFTYALNATSEAGNLYQGKKRTIPFRLSGGFHVGHVVPVPLSHVNTPGQAIC